MPPKIVFSILSVTLPLTALLIAASGIARAQDISTVIDTRADRQLGELLTDSGGRTLYFATQDGTCESVCTGPCERNWPPLLLAELPPLLLAIQLASEAGAITGTFDIAVRADGTRQLCYNGRPLYTSNRDKAVTDTRGHGIGNNWYAANVLPVVQVRRDSRNEAYLAGPTGMTLYTSQGSWPSAHKCRRGCAENWPPLLIGHESLAAVGLSGKLGVIKRDPPDHRLQLTYEGKPLHYWSRDRVPGDMMGDGIGDLWSVARPVPGSP